MFLLGANLEINIDRESQSLQNREDVPTYSSNVFSRRNWSQSLQNREDVPTCNHLIIDTHLSSLNPFKTGKMFLLDVRTVKGRSDVSIPSKQGRCSYRKPVLAQRRSTVSIPSKQGRCSYLSWEAEIGFDHESQSLQNREDVPTNSLWNFSSIMSTSQSLQNREDVPTKQRLLQTKSSKSQSLQNREDVPTKRTWRL